MKKICLLLFIGLFINTGLKAQSLNINNVTDVVRQGRLNNIDVENKKINFSEIKDSPFWDDDFVRGQILVKQDGEEKIISAFIRYRIFDDMFEVKKNKTDPDSQITTMKRSKDIAVKLKDKKFVLLMNLPITIRGVRNGYSMILVAPKKDGDATLYKRLSQKFIPAKAPKNPYDTGKKARLDENDFYFVKIDGQLYNVEPHKKKAFKNFPDHNKELKGFISKNKMKFKNKTKDQDMIRLVNFYNTL